MNSSKTYLKWSNELPDFTDNVKERLKRITPAFRFRYRKTNYCSDCGKPESECQCHKEYFGTYYKQKTLNFYCNVFTVYHGIQVVRTLWVSKTFNIGEPCKINFHDVYHNWLDPDRRVIIGKKIKFMGYDNFDFNSEFRIKKLGHGRFGYDFSSWNVHVRFSEDFKKRGCDRIPKWADKTNWILSMMYDNKMETLYKIGVLNKTLFNFHDITTRYYNQILKAHKHGIIIDDYNIWFDCFRMMENLGMDINNPSLYLPVKESLMDIHDRLLKLVEKKREKEMKEKAKKKALEQEKTNSQYIKRMKLFMGLSINSGNIIISPLENIKDFFIEGEMMHHCVYTMEYYKKKRSIILSAKNTDGDRIETIEYDTLTNQVIQSRGKCNSSTDYHDTIVNAVENSLELKKLCKKYVKKHYNS